MNAVILDSVIRLTEQRNIDSLAYSLAATVAELLPIDYIAIRSEDRFQTCSISLEIADDAEQALRYKWQSESQVDVSERMFIDQCKRLNQTVLESHAKQSILAVPVFDKDEAIGAIIIRSKNDLSQYRPIVEGMAKIYSNYQVLLAEVDRDQLTGLFNRRHFDRSFPQILSRSHSAYIDNRKVDAGLWLVSIDIDHFKAVNDQYGHICGDEVLLTFANTLQSELRKGDAAFRFGGEEFILLINARDEQECFESLQRLHQAIAAQSFPLVGEITVSMGFTSVSIQDFPLAAIERSDKALYYAKENGRKQTQSYENLVSLGKLTSYGPEPGDVELF